MKVLSPPGAPHEANPHQVIFDAWLGELRREKLIASYPDGADRSEYGTLGLIPFAFAGGGEAAESPRAEDSRP